eukprot:gene28513-37468_t
MLSSVNTSSNNSLNNIASSSNTSSNNTSGNISVSLSRGDAELVPQVEFLDSQPMNLQLKELSRKKLWSKINNEIEQIPTERENFFDQAVGLNVVHELLQEEHGLTSSKKNSKNGSVIQVINKDAVMVTAKACEMLVLDLTLRALHNMNEHGQKTLSKSDILDAISTTEVYDIFDDIR